MSNKHRQYSPQKTENINSDTLSSLYERKNYLLTQNELKFYKLIKNFTDRKKSKSFLSSDEDNL